MSKKNEITAITAGSQERVAPFNQRFDFGSYAETRDFLDRLEDLSKRDNYYPNISFGKTYVNVSIDGEDQTALNERKSTFISEMKALTTVGKT